VRWSGFVFLSLVSACAVFDRTPADAPASAAAAPAANAPAPTKSTAAPPAATVPTPAVASPTAPKVTAVPVPAGTTPPKTASATKAPPVKISTPAPAAAKTDAAPHLDLAALEQRLRASNAIGTFTKIALKNEVDDLTGKFREYHDGRSRSTLQELRQPYELLMMKVLSLLQNDDPALANEIARSREAIWGILSDKTKFTQI
jgi:hypothetical protein